MGGTIDSYHDGARNSVVPLESPYKKIIITHGTYTMPDSARYLKANLKRKDQAIIPTGSMIPIDGFTFSDGGFNLGFAVSKAQDIRAGIYICFKRKLFSLTK